MRYQSPFSVLRKVWLATMGLTTALLLTGCASGGGGFVDVDNLPSFMEGDVTRFAEGEPGIIFGRGSGESTQMRVARSIARSVALGDLADAMRVQIDNWTRNLDDQMGTAGGTVTQAFTEAQAQILSEELVGVQERDSQIQEDRESGIYRVFVLLGQDPGAASAAIMARMREQEAAYARFRQTEVFDEMEEVIENYNRRRGGR
jgi:hypothetical protein